MFLNSASYVRRNDFPRMNSSLYWNGFLIILAIRLAVEGCDLERAKRCVQTLETSHQGWKESEKCIEFAKSDGAFSHCKTVLAGCTQEVELLKRLSFISVQLENACKKVCPPFEDLKKQCNIGMTVIISKKYTEFCSQYETARICAEGFLDTCAIAKEFQLKAVVTAQFAHIHRNICNKACTNLDSTVDAMDACGNLYEVADNCSTAKFDSCVNQLNATLCPEHKNLYGLWLPPNCTTPVQNKTRSDESTRTSDVTSTISTLIDTVTSKQPKITESSSTSQSKSQTEGLSSSAYNLGGQNFALTTVVLLLTSTAASFLNGCLIFTKR